MERLIKPIADGGVPYINQDFVNILQDNNIKSYNSYLETVNDMTGRNGNSGIIIKGIKNINGTFNLQNSVVYITPNESGIPEYMELLPTEPTTYTPSANITSFYIIPTTTFQDREAKVTGLPVGYMIADQTTGQTDQETHMLINNYFKIVEVLPSTVKNYILFQKDSNGSSTTEWVSSRYLDRILKYHMADFGQIFMTTEENYFYRGGPKVGQGFGPMSGFKWLSQSSNPNIDFKGKWLVNYDSGVRFNGTPNNIGPPSVATPAANTNTTNSEKTRNYRKLGNTGGFESVLLEQRHILAHTHSDYTGFADNFLKHDHEFYTSMPIKFSDLKSEFNQSSFFDSGIIGEDTQRFHPFPIFGWGKKLGSFNLVDRSMVNISIDQPYPSRTIDTYWNTDTLSTNNINHNPNSEVLYSEVFKRPPFPPFYYNISNFSRGNILFPLGRVTSVPAERWVAGDYFQYTPNPTNDIDGAYPNNQRKIGQFASNAPVGTADYNTAPLAGQWKHFGNTYYDTNNDPIALHKHPINSTGSPHNNIPRTHIVIYYEKIAV